MATSYLKLTLVIASCVLHIQGCQPKMDLLTCAQYYGGDMFVDLVNKTDLQAMFKGGELKTIFMPISKSFHALPDNVLKNMTIMRDVMKYHLVNGYVDDRSWKNEDLISTANKGVNIRVNIYENKTANLTTVSGSWAIMTRLNATNGYINLISRVMFPLPTTNLFTEVAIGNNFKIFLLLVTKAGLQSTLQGGSYTVFVPNDNGFDKLPQGTLASWMEDIPKLKGILFGHVVEGTVYTDAFDILRSVKTLSNNTITTGRLRIGSAMLVGKMDQSAVNGVLHEIDSVLPPP